MKKYNLPIPNTLPPATPLQIAQRKAERLKSDLRSIPENIFIDWSYRLLFIMNLAWTYIETCLDMAAILRIKELKPVSRRIRELKREYDIFRHSSMTDKMLRFETEMGEKFEDTFINDFKMLYFNLDSEVAKHDLNAEYRQLVIAVQQCLTVMQATREYCARCESTMRTEYGITPPPDCMIQKEFIETMRLIPLYAGDCYEADSPTRRTCANALANRLEKFPISIEIFTQNSEKQ